MSLLETIAQSYAADERHTAEVPEWGVDGEPLRVSFTKLTLAQGSTCMIGAKNDPMMFSAYVVAHKLCDADGKRLFNTADALRLAETADPAVLLRLSKLISPPALNAEAQEEAEKN